ERLFLAAFAGLKDVADDPVERGRERFALGALRSGQPFDHRVGVVEQKDDAAGVAPGDPLGVGGLAHGWVLSAKGPWRHGLGPAWMERLNYPPPRRADQESC